MVLALASITPVDLPSYDHPFTKHLVSFNNKCVQHECMRICNEVPLVHVEPNIAEFWFLTFQNPSRNIVNKQTGAKLAPGPHFFYCREALIDAQGDFTYFHNWK